MFSRKIFRGQEIVLENIYYDFDESFIRDDAQPTLNELSDLLTRNPGIRIELNESEKGNLSFNIRNIGIVGEETKLVSHLHAAISARPYSVEFESNDLYSLLSQPDLKNLALPSLARRQGLFFWAFRKAERGLQACRYRRASPAGK